MNRPKRILGAAGLFAAALALCPPPGLSLHACTTAVISGAATANGRPLLWKNRDADDLQNQVVFCADGKYSYIGLVNRGDAAGEEIWAGMNEKGFAIMNAASYNLEADAGTEAEGRFMKLALQSCGTLVDFQALLEMTDPGGRDVSSNFGVIDASGGAAYFEAGRHRYRRFNADDPAIAPRGFLVRTNYSESADDEKGTGFLRRERAQGLIEGLVKDRKLSVETLLREVARDVANVRIGSFPLAPRKKGTPAFAYTGDSVCRYITSSAVVFEGAGSGRDPLLATAWVLLGQPITGAAVPLWVGARGVPPELAVGEEAAPLNAAFGEIRDQFYPDGRGDLSHYVDLESLNPPKGGLVQGLLGIEGGNVRLAQETAASWGQQAPDRAQLASLQNMLAKQTLSSVLQLLETGRRSAPGKPREGRRAKPADQPKGPVTITDLPR
jgi:hypothetical protein